MRDRRRWQRWSQRCARHCWHARGSKAVHPEVQCATWLTVNYTGYDVVQSVIEADKKVHASNPAWQFYVADLTTVDIKQGVDLILCRDALQHLSHSKVWKVLQVFQRAKPEFLMVPN
jgi:hypothetical protein